MRISDWSSDVCSSDLRGGPARGDGPGLRPVPRLPAVLQVLLGVPNDVRGDRQPRRPGRGQAHHRGAGPGRRRVLQLQALLRELPVHPGSARVRSEEHTSELQSLMRISYAVFCLKKKKKTTKKSKLQQTNTRTTTTTKKKQTTKI